MKFAIHLFAILVLLGIAWGSTNDETNTQIVSGDEQLNDEITHSIAKRSHRTCGYYVTKYRADRKSRSQRYYATVYYKTCWFNSCTRSRTVTRYRTVYYYVRVSYRALQYYTCYNGATCGSKCNCRAGWTSTYCNIDINECTRSPCSSRENCLNNAGSYSCSCKTGYRRIGTLCYDINECTSSPCRRANEQCINLAGSYRCDCKSGYTRGSYSQCVDTNECSSSNGRCSHNCHNTAGSYFCTCRTGYRLSGRSCYDINECSLNTDRCNQGCTNTAGGYTCLCNNGYYLSSTYTCTLVRFSVSASGSLLSSTSVRFSWRTTFNPSSRRVSVYHYLYSRDLSFSSSDVYRYRSLSTSYTVTVYGGFLPYRNYRFYIKAIGGATTVNSNYVTIRTPESRPSSGANSIIASVLSSSQIRVSWSAPSRTNQNGILRSYTILYATSRSNQLRGVGSSRTVSVSTTSYTLTGLSTYTNYWLSVAASTSRGRGPYTSRSSAVRTSEGRPTAAPRVYYYIRSSNYIYIRILPPSSTTQINGVITFYYIYYQGVNVDTSTRYTVVSRTSSNYLSGFYVYLYPLQEGVAYRIRAIIYTHVGGGPSSSTLTITTSESAPSGTPQNAVFTRVLATSLSLRWNPPTLKDQNGVITGYRLTYRGSVDTRSRVIDTRYTYATLSNLDEGSTYTIDIRAKNSRGNGPSIVVTRTTTEIAPNGPPRYFVVRSNSPTSISVSWQPPSTQAQNGIITGYQIKLVGRGHDTNTFSIDVIQSVRSYTIYRLEEGHSYQVTIRSKNSVGFGPSTNAIIISTRESAPGTTPENLRGVQGTTWISLMWNPPRVADQNGNITKYQIEYSGTSLDQNNGSFYTTAMTTNISNLEEYEFYRIRIRAYTAIGPGPFSSQLALRTSQDAPSAPPRSIRLNVLSPTQISLRWSSPPINDQNGVLTGFRIVIASDYNSYNQSVSVSSTNSYHLFMNLHPYVNYSVQVRAETNPGSGPYSTAITAETHQAAPSGTLLNVEVTSSVRDISVRWQPPLASEQNGIITGYLVKYRGLVIDSEMKNFTTQNIFANLNNLHPGNDYQISLCAFTYVGVGPCLMITNSTTSIPPSEPPKNITVTASGSTSLLISWEPPAILDRNGIITSYIIIAIEKGHDSSVHRHNVNPNLRSFAIDNLEEAHYYDVSISAENKAGNGPFTQNFTIVTNGAAPSSAPQNVHGISNQTSIFVLWDAPPAPDHNGVITKYELSYEGTIQDTTTNNSLFETELRAILSNLHVNELYQIRVRAFTAFGPGPYSTTVLFRTLESIPTAPPESVTLTSDSDTQITVTWENPPLEDRNGVLIGFDLSIVSGDNSYQDEASVTAPRQTYSFTGLRPYSSYSIKVRATTQPGSGPYSQMTILTQQAAPSGTPRNVQATISSNNLILTWDAPDPSLQNGIIVDYQLTYEGTAVDTNEITIRTTNNTATLTGLEEGEEYSVQICAMTVAIGPCIQWMNFTSEAIPTGEPINIQIQAITATAITISWNSPILALQNGIITGYEVVAVGQQHDSNEYKTNLTRNVLSYTFENLEESHGYNLKLRARNAIGFGPFTTIVTVITLEAATGAAPLNFTANSTETSITLYWNPPHVQHHNGILRYYEIEYYSTSDFLSMELRSANISASRNDITIDNLQEYSEYQFKVRAYTSVGPGPYSPEITVTTQQAQPSSAPTNLQAEDLTDTQIQVTWNPPSAIDQNGPITQYQILVSQTTYQTLPTNNTYTTSQTIHTINALHPSTSYSIQVRAENSIGVGPYTTSVTATTREAVPSAPPTHLTLISVTHESANFSWRSPMPDSLNGALQAYTLNITNTQTSTSYIETSTTAHTRLDSLTPNSRYSLAVAAVNSQGTGPYTSELFFSTQQSPPTGPPQISQITDNSPHSISLQWETIPTNFQNGAILSYTVNISTSEDNRFISSQTVLQPTTTATFSNLHPYTEYTLAVSGDNAAGTSPPDYETHTTEEALPTGAPTSLSTIPSFTSITLSWQPPNITLQNGRIIEYSIRFQSSTYTTNTTQYVITGLEEFTTFQWSVAAWNSIGAGPYSQVESVSTLANPPSEPPQNVTARALSYQSIFVSWEPVPLSHQNGIILNYIVYFQGGKFDVSEGKIVEPANTTSATLIHLKPNENYKITVVAENSQGSSARSPSLFVVTYDGTPSVAPTGFTAHYTSPTSIVATWISIPSHEQNGYLTNYEIVYFGNKFDVGQSKLTTPGNVTTALLMDLHPDVQYTMLVRGLTSVGNGPNSQSLNVLLPESIPTGAPDIDQIDVASNTSIYVAWSGVDPSEMNGIIIAYEVRYSPKVSTENTNPAFYLNSSLVTLNITLNGLEDGTLYEISVRSYTAVGPGPFSDIITGTTAPNLVQCYAYYNQYFHNPCNHNGTCLSGDVLPFVCQCSPGYTDHLCLTDVDDCEINHCGTSGRCVDQVNGYMCVCDAGFTGKHCDGNIDDCDQNSCQNGTCIDGVEKYTCSCNPNYSGTYCQYFNTCSSSPCIHGSCLWANYSYSCACELGYEGGHCEANIDDCVENDCQYGKCIDGINQYTCKCSQGYKGNYCELKITATACESQDLAGFKWKETKFGTSVTMPCEDANPGLTGTATRMCENDGDWGKLDVSNCTRLTYEKLEIELKNHTKQSSTLTPIVAENLSNRLEEVICNDSSKSSEGSTPTFYPYEISVITQVLVDLVKSIETQDTTTQGEMVRMMTPGILCVISRIVNLRNMQIFHNTDSSSQAIVISELVEKVAKLNAQHFDTSQSTEHLTFDHENIQLFVAPLINKQSATIPDYTLSAVKDTGLHPDSVYIPESEVSSLFSKANGGTPVIALVFNRYIGQAMGMHYVDPSFGISSVGTRVITVQSNMGDHLIFKEPISLKYWVHPPYNASHGAICASWDGENWSDEGMQIASRKDNTITCASNHATSFAVLLSSQPQQPLTEGENDFVTSLVTYALALVSLVALIASLLMLLLLGKTLLKKDLYLIHFNLGIALTFALIFCILGTQNIPLLASLPILCKMFAVLFQYFAFASLSWSFCNVIQIIYMLYAKVKLRRTILIMLCVGWLFPLIIVGPVVWRKWSDYGVAGKYCWLSEDSMTFWLIVGPLLGMNLIVLILSLYTICRISTSKPKTEWYIDARNAVFGLLLLSVVVAVPWVMSLVDFFIQFQFYKWSFAIIYTLQGLIFLIFYAIGNLSVRTQLFRMKRKSDSLQDSPNSNGRSHGGRISNDFQFQINNVLQSDYVNPLYNEQNMDCTDTGKQDLDCKGACSSKVIENEYKINLDLQEDTQHNTLTKLPFSKESPYQSMEKIHVGAEDNPYAEIHENKLANPFIGAGLGKDTDSIEETEMVKINPFTEENKEVIYTKPKRSKTNPPVYGNENAGCPSEVAPNPSEQTGVAKTSVGNCDEPYDTPTQDECQAKANLVPEETYVNEGFAQENSGCDAEPLEKLGVETNIGNPCYRAAEGSVNFAADRISSADSDSETDV